MIKLKNVSKYYYKKGIIATGITKINLEFNLGEFVAITGESGSGKSTLLNVISGLDSYEEGEMYINGEETSHYREKDFEDYRRKYIGNIFQSFNLINSYTVYQNIELVLLLNGYKRQEIKSKILGLIDQVELSRFKNTKVSKLSGGQKQRVAIARALAKETPIIIADEPTGNLDKRSAEGIIELLSKIAKDKLVIVVTHNYEQVEKYVTRKIKMHDGRILEDKSLKKYSVVKNKSEYEYHDIRLGSKLLLGIRNVFNIIPKFLLLLVVFLFIVLAVMGEYTSFKELEYQEELSGYNYLFHDLSDKRLLIKKADGSFINDDDFKALEKVENVDYLIKNDYMIDNMFTLTDDNNLYVYGMFRNIQSFNDSVDYGRMPEADDEVIIMGYEYDYYLTDMRDDLLKTSLKIVTDYQDDTNARITLKVVGIKYFNDNTHNYENIIYGSSQIEEKLSYITNKMFITVKSVFENNLLSTYIRSNSKVAKGKVYIPESIFYLCPNERCSNRTLSINAHSIYYDKDLSLKVQNVFNKDNIKYRLGIKSYDENSNTIFINPDDYKLLYPSDIYQSSVYLKDVKLTDITIATLTSMGYKTLLIKDTLVSTGTSELFIILKTVVTIILLIVLFFISYFVIKIILKSRNVYFATIRMLGANKKVVYDLLVIDLLVVANIAYIIVLFLIFLCYKNIININFIMNMLSYLAFKDYALIYIILLIMSLLVSTRYARKLFKNTAMMTFREEV